MAVKGKSESAVAVAEKSKPAPARSSPKPKKLPPYNVVRLDDDDHSYEYVIRMLGQLFGHSREKAFKMACEVDQTGRVIVLTTTKEHAELKRDQIHAFGADKLLARSKGSMRAVIDPAPQ